MGLIFIKLFLAHILADFILQPDWMVEHKRTHKSSSKWLYAHVALHGLLSALLTFDADQLVQTIGIGLSMAVLHFAIDVFKLYKDKDASERWFFIDQGLHLISLLMVTIVVSHVDFDYFTPYFDKVAVFSTAVIFLTMPASLVVRKIIAMWLPRQPDETIEEHTLTAGRYIGILERLFVFGFIVSGNPAAIGFLLGAKSVFRFGDLTKSKDLHLTEYFLTGTLLSFGIASLVGVLTLFALR
jgi:hypothetical protein